MSLSATELIVRADGSIYHLGIKPENIAHTILTVGDPERVTAITRHFDKIDFKGGHREFMTHTGWYRGKHLTVISTGIGTDNIDIVLNELDALVNIDLDTRTRKPVHTALTIIRVGTSGALQPQTVLGTITYATLAIGLDNLMHFYDYDPPGVEGLLAAELADTLDGQSELMVFPYVTSAHADLLADRLPKSWLAGITVTAPGFYAPQGRYLRAKPAEGKLLQILSKVRMKRMPVTNMEMETSAIYGLANMLGHRALSVSVLLANRATQEFHNNPESAIEQLIDEVLAWLVA
jgi:uridine phosphorylase